MSASLPRRALPAALPFLLVLAACDDDPVGPETAQLSLQISSAPELEVPVDSATVHLEGPTPRTVSADEGEVVVIGSLEPGTYQVGVEGWSSERIAWFSELTVRLEAGEEAERVVTVDRLFVPDEVTATEEEGVVSLQWDAVPGAVEYLIVTSSGRPESDPVEEQDRTSATTFQTGPLGAGDYTFRVQALNRFGNGGPRVELAVTVAPDLFTLDVTVSGSGSGVVTSTPEGIDCGSDCQEPYPEGSTVTLTAEADAGSTFDGWEGAGCTGTDPCAVTLDQDQTVTATFTLDPVSFPVTVQVEEGGELPVGSVVSEPEGIRCGDGYDDCSAEFSEEQEVVLTHRWPEALQGTPDDAGTGFGGWSGDCEGFDRCVLSMDGSKEVVATAAAELVTYRTETRIEDSDGWFVPELVNWVVRWEERAFDCFVEILPNDGANSPTYCTARVAPGLRMSLSSEVGPVDWDGACESIEENTCHVVVGPNSEAIYPVWDWSPPEGHSILQVDYYGGDGGAVRSDVAGIYPEGNSNYARYPLACGAYDSGSSKEYLLQCSQVFPDGTPVTLTPSPRPGYEFTGWSGAGCTGAGPCVVVMDQSYKVTPLFAPVGAVAAGASSGDRSN
ncbi:MAG: hypothetical protein P8188_18115 [Gemmatimonadota bacterium]